MSETPETTEVSTPESAAANYATIGRGSHKGSSIKEGFICSGIWAVASAVLVVSLRLWTEHTNPERGILSADDWAHYVGSTLGLTVLMGILMSAVVYYRRKKNITSLFLLDWRWWLVCAFLTVHPAKPALAWLWVGGIYNVRLYRTTPKV